MIKAECTNVREGSIIIEFQAKTLDILDDLKSSIDSNRLTIDGYGVYAIIKPTTTTQTPIGTPVVAGEDESTLADGSKSDSSSMLIPIISVVTFFFSNSVFYLLVSFQVLWK